MALIEVKDLKMHFPMRNNKKIIIKAVDGVSFSIQEGRTFGLVGESGCGKSTTARSIIKLYHPTGGRVIFNGEDITNYKNKQLLEYRKSVQMVFQDPYASLNPRMTVAQTIMDPMIIHGITNVEQRGKRVAELMEMVGLDQRFAKRYPHEFSGGQRQRIGIARALALNPKVLVLDEPVSALDVSVQSQILNLLKSLQSELHLTYLFISHNLSVVDYMCDNIAVMYLGRVVEKATNKELFSVPKHPYTKALLSAIPRVDGNIDKNTAFLPGDIPSPANPPSGCSFHTRCPYAIKMCREETPNAHNITDSHCVYCHLGDKV